MILNGDHLVRALAGVLHCQNQIAARTPSRNITRGNAARKTQNIPPIGAGVVVVHRGGAIAAPEQVGVVTRIALQPVAAGPAAQCVVTAAAVNPIIARAAVQRVIAAITTQRIVTAQAVQGVGRGITQQGIGARRAFLHQSFNPRHIPTGAIGKLDGVERVAACAIVDEVMVDGDYFVRALPGVLDRQGQVVA